MTDITVENKFTLEEERRADELKAEIKLSLSIINQAHKTAESSFAQVGAYLLEVRNKKFWLLWDFQTFGDFIESLEFKGRTQLYNTISVAEKLLPHSSIQDVTEMGISKANVLAKSGTKPSDDILEKAKNPDVTISELKAAVFEANNQQPDGQEKGTYRDLGGFYATNDEWAEIQQAFNYAEQIDPAIRNEVPAFIRMKEILLRMSREFIAQYGPQFEGEYETASSGG